VSGLTSGQHRAVLFDLVGTLVDSFPGIARAYHHVLTQSELGDMDDIDLVQFIGPLTQEVLQGTSGSAGPGWTKVFGRFGTTMAPRACSGSPSTPALTTCSLP